MSDLLRQAVRRAVTAAALVRTVVFASTVRSRRQAQGALLVEESRSAAQQAARAVLEEQTRIARELHDVVAHHMSVIAIQAEAAPLRAGGGATALATELAEIRSTALDSMREMRRILGVLREDSVAPTTAPAPGSTTSTTWWSTSTAPPVTNKRALDIPLEVAVQAVPDDPESVWKPDWLPLISPGPNTIVADLSGPERAPLLRTSHASGVRFVAPSLEHAVRHWVRAVREGYWTYDERGCDEHSQGKSFEELTEMLVRV